MLEPKSKIGRLLLLEAKSVKNGFVWKCLCDCGKTVNMYESRINGGTRSCGCIKKEWHKSVVNKKFGKLTVLKQTKEVYIDGGKCWLCKCECGNKCLSKRSDFALRKTCGKCHIDYSKVSIANTENEHWKILDEVGKKYKDRIYKAICKYCQLEVEKPYYVLVYQQLHGCGCLRKEKLSSSKHNRNFDDYKYNSIYCDYKKSAIKRNYVFEFTKEELIELIHKPCFYCNRSNLGRRKIGKRILELNGIDRVKNEIGYTKANSVPCCKICNHLKGTMTVDEFKQIVKLIYINLGLENYSATN